MQLTKREAAYVEGYKRGLRGTELARYAGYKDGPGLAVAASKVLRRPHVREALGLPAEAIRQRRGTKKRAAKAPPAAASKPASDPPAGDYDAILAKALEGVTDPEERLLITIREDVSQPAAQRRAAARDLRELLDARAAAAEAVPEEDLGDDDDPHGIVLICNGRGPRCGDTVECAMAHLRRLTAEQRGEVLQRLGLRVVGQS